MYKNLQIFSRWPNYQRKNDSYTALLGALTMYFLSSFEIVYNLQVILDGVISFFQTPSLAVWLNDWNMIDTELSGEDSCNYLDKKMRKTRNNLAIFLIILPTLFFACSLYFVGRNKGHPFALGFEMVHVYISGNLLGGEDVKTGMIFWVLKSAFEKVCHLLRVVLNEN